VNVAYVSLLIFVGTSEVGVSTSFRVPAVGEYIEYHDKGGSGVIQLGRVDKVLHRVHGQLPVITVTPFTH
jgi:hypothetical protein